MNLDYHELMGKIEEKELKSSVKLLVLLQQKKKKYTYKL